MKKQNNKRIGMFFLAFAMILLMASPMVSALDDKISPSPVEKTLSPLLNTLYFEDIEITPYENKLVSYDYNSFDWYIVDDEKRWGVIPKTEWKEAQDFHFHVNKLESEEVCTPINEYTSYCEKYVLNFDDIIDKNINTGGYYEIEEDPTGGYWINLYDVIDLDPVFEQDYRYASEVILEDTQVSKFGVSIERTAITNTTANYVSKNGNLKLVYPAFYNDTTRYWNVSFNVMDGDGEGVDMGDNSIVDYWTLDGTFNSTRGTHNCTVSHGSPTERGGLSSNSYYFNGDDALDCGDNDDLSFTYGNGTDKPFTVSSWVYIDDISNNEVILGREDSTTQSNREWAFFHLDNQIALLIFDVEGHWVRRNANITSLDANSWIHVVFAYNGNNTAEGIEIYINGERRDESSQASAGTYDGMSNTAEPLRFGRRDGSSAFYYDGYLDEVIIYNKTLNQSEINKVYDLGLTQNANTNITVQTRTSDEYNLTDSGLVSAYDFAENANDQKGVNNCSLMNSPTLTENGTVYNAYHYDGIDKYIDCGNENSFDNLSLKTISTWIKLDQDIAVDTDGWDIISKYNDSSTDGWILLATKFYGATETRGLTFSQTFDNTDGIWTSNTLYTDANATPLEKDRWFHVAVTYDNTNVNNDPVMYINGQLQPTDERVAPVGNVQSDANFPMLIGARDEGDGTPLESRVMNGTIDETRIYNRILSEAEIMDLYEMGSGFMDWTDWSAEEKIVDNTVERTNIGGKYYQFRTNFYTNDTQVSPYLLNHSVVMGEEYEPDQTAPNLTIVAPLAQTYNNATQLVNISAQDENLDTVWFYNGTDNETYTTSVYRIFNEGSNTLTAWANDTVGNENTTSVVFTIDTIAPTVNIVYPIATDYNIDINELNYTSSEGGSCWYSTDGGTTNSSVAIAGSNFTGLSSAEGSNIWVVYCNDTLGNEGSDSVTFNKDTVNPSVVITKDPAGNLEFGVDSVEINCTAEDLNGIDAFNFTILNPAGGLLVEDLTANASETLTPAQLTSLGQYNVSCFANDTFGNYNTTTSFTVVQDTINPSLVLTVNNTLLEFGVDNVFSDCNASDMHGINTFNYNVTYEDGTVIFNDNTANASVTLGPLELTSLGNYTFNCRATDASSNYNSSFIIAVVEDTTDPTITNVLAKNSTGGNIIGKGYNVTINATVTDLETVNSVWVVIWESIVGGAEYALEFLENTVGDVWSVDVEIDGNLSAGEINYTVYANDSSDNEASQNEVFTLTWGVEEPNSSSFPTGEGSTDFSTVPDIANVTNMTLATADGRIQFPADYGVNATQQDYNNNVVIGSDFVSVNTPALDSSFNATTTITLNNVDCPQTVYVADGFYSTNDDIVDNGEICTAPTCTNFQCSAGVLTFDVAHFTGYGTQGTANLTIYDDSDSGRVRPDETVNFYANYTNVSTPITGATCNISFTDESAIMGYSGGLYTYDRTFSTHGTYSWNVTCNKTDFDTVSAVDTVEVFIAREPICDNRSSMILVQIFVALMGLAFVLNRWRAIGEMDMEEAIWTFVLILIVVILIGILLGYTANVTGSC